MPSRASVLIFGKDPMLLDTRRWVLERAGAAAYEAKEVAEVAAVLQAQSIAILVLCHSVAMDESEKAMKVAREISPRTRHVVLMASLANVVPDFGDDEMERIYSRPETLVATVQRMLAEPKASA